MPRFTENRRFRKSQQGSVAIMVGLTLVILIGMLALVVDLGHAYLVKTGLQNGADAAALAGAKELNGKLSGVAAARDKAIELARENDYAFSSPVGTGAADGGLDLFVGSCPDDGCMVPIASVTDDASASSKSFLKVDTRQRNLNTWFARVLGMAQMPTSAVAVAGRFLAQVTPIGVCAVDKTRPEDGFVRGVSYNISKLNPLSNGDPIWINPIDSAPGPCSSNSTSTTNMAPFVCTGSATTISSIPGTVWVDTGSKTAMQSPLNSRFGVPTSYTGGHACNPATAPADTNVTEFKCTRTGGPNPDNCANPPGGSTTWPRDWMDTTTNTTPTVQSIAMNGIKPFNYPLRQSPETGGDFSQYGVLWSFSRELNYATSPPTPYTPADWPSLYGGNAQNYPATSPYLQFVTPPTGAGAASATPERRVLKLAIIDCSGIVLVPGQVCSQQLPVIAIGKFFMQTQANLPGQIAGEFSGLLDSPMPPSEIRLYR